MYKQLMKNKNIIGTSIGTMLEFYDYTLYGIFAITFASMFFPKNDSATTLSLFIYALSSYIRPFGGLVFGYLSDTKGRKKALMISIFLMTVSTIGVGCLPAYEDTGIYSLILLIFFRCIQGFSSGGEYNNTVIYAYESQNKLPGFFSGLVVSSVTTGTLVAMILSAIALKSQYTFAWRIPFLVGGILGLVGLYYRKHLSESPAFQNNSDLKILNGFFSILKDCKQPLLKTILIGGISSVLALTIFHYINIYLSNIIGFSNSQSASISIIGIAGCIIAIPLFGLLSDHINPYKIIVFSSFITLISSYLIYQLLSSGKILYIILAQFILILLSSSISASAHPYLINLFPPSLRCLGLSFGFTLGIAIFGGIMPLVSNIFIDYTNNVLSPSFYLMSISLITLITLIPEMIKSKQNEPEEFLVH